MSWISNWEIKSIKPRQILRQISNLRKLITCDRNSVQKWMCYSLLFPLQASLQHNLVDIAQGCSELRSFQPCIFDSKIWVENRDEQIKASLCINCARLVFMTPSKATSNGKRACEMLIKRKRCCSEYLEKNLNLGG